MQSCLREHQRIREEIQEQYSFDERMERLYFTLGTREHLSFGERNILEFLITQGYECWVPYDHQTEGNPAVKIHPVHSEEILKRFR